MHYFPQLKAAAIVLVMALPGSGQRLRGVVLDEGRKPAAGAVVSLRIPGAPQPLLSFSSWDGSYSFPNLKPLTDYEVKADSGPLASTAHTLRLSSSSETAIIELVIGPRIRFEEVAEKAGLSFTLRNGATGHSYQPEIMLGGVAAFDFDNDGCMDIFATNGGTLPDGVKTGPEYSNRLFRNNCDLTFTDVTEKSGLRGTGYSMGVGAGDFDGDGFTDLAVTALDGVRLYRNRGNGTFEDVTVKSGVVAKHWAVSAGWFDYDNDGHPDLFITNYVVWSPALDKCTAAGAPYYCDPRVYKGFPNQLFHNNGDGTFTDVSDASGIGAAIGKGMGLAFGDFNGDGLTDVFVANDSVPNFLFQNLGHGKFREVALTAGVAYAAHGNAVAGMGADFRDYDNDGLDDIALDAMYFDTFPLYRNGKSFTDETASSGVALATRNSTGWGMGLFDFDNDGYKDLFFATSHFPGSKPYVHEEAESSNRVLRNTGNGAFEDVSVLAGADFQRIALFHGAAFADFDNDGRLDVVVSAVNGALRLFHNISPDSGHWLAVRLTGKSGAKVKVILPSGNTLYNHSTTAAGYASSSEPVVRFGLGPYDFASRIDVAWPGGLIQTLTGVKADQVLEVIEPKAPGKASASSPQ